SDFLDFHLASAFSCSSNQSVTIRSTFGSNDEDFRRASWLLPFVDPPVIWNLPRRRLFAPHQRDRRLELAPSRFPSVTVSLSRRSFLPDEQPAARTVSPFSRR